MSNLSVRRPSNVSTLSNFTGTSNGNTPMTARSNMSSVSASSGSSFMSSLDNSYNKFKQAAKNLFPGEDPAKKAKRKANAQSAYERKRNATRKTWLASHGMPKNVPVAEGSRINKEARDYAMKLYGRNVFAGGKRSRKANRKGRKTRKGRKASLRTRRR